MTTAKSPLSRLKRQAESMAAELKKIDRGESTAIDPLGKLAQSKATGRFKFAVVMDDQTITIEIPWSKISESSELVLTEFLLKQMRQETSH